VLLADVLRLLQREGSLLPGEVARRLGISVDEAEGALAVLVVTGRVRRSGSVGSCPGECGPCTWRARCPLASPVGERPVVHSANGTGAGVLP